MPYTSDVNHVSPKRQDISGPLIIGKQEDTCLEQAFANLGVNYHSTYENKALSAPLIPHLNRPMPGGRPIGYHEEYSNEQSRSSAEGYLPAFMPCSSGARNPGSSALRPFSDYGLHSSPWPAFYPGAIGQERGVTMFPHVRPACFPPQQGPTGKFARRHNNEFSSGHHNVVDVERIRQGTDVRTTVCDFKSSQIILVCKAKHNCRLCCETFRIKSIR